MFEQLKRFPRIFVTGAHRSGTTIATEMIAESLGLECLREEVIGFNDPYLFDHFAFDLSRRDFVLQCPAMFYRIREIQAPNTAIVFMRRDFDDIQKSQSSQTYPGGAPLPFDREEARQRDVLDMRDNENSNEAKWRLWNEWNVRNGFTQEYEDLKQHPMWVDREQRKGWHHRQTK